jgi:ABC-2 type transport system permease protein
MQKHLIKAYLRVWLKLTAQQFQSQIANARGAAILFIFSKLFRLGTAFLFIWVIMERAKLIAGYNLSQAVFILALFNLVSSITQLFMRGIYLFRQKVVDGTFDFYLLNPLSELFYSLFSYTDPLDLILFLPYLGIVIWAWVWTGFPLTLLSVLLILLTIFIAEIMILSWHIFIIGIGVRYLEVDNTIMLYRDLEKMASMPIEIYGKYGSAILTYVFPFALMATIPARIVFELFNPVYLVAFATRISRAALSLWHWRRSLLNYLRFILIPEYNHIMTSRRYPHQFRFQVISAWLADNYCPARL